MHIGKLFGVGIGPGDPKYLTLRAVEVLQSVDIIFTVISKNATCSTSEDVVSFVNSKAKIQRLMFTMSNDTNVRSAQVLQNAQILLEHLRNGKHCAFATLGDAMTYSTFGYMLEIIQKELHNIEIEIVPGITSFATLAAKAQTVLVENQEELRIIPSFKTELAKDLHFSPKSTTILLKTYHSRDALIERLQEEHDIEVTYAEHLGMEKEYISCQLHEIKQRPKVYLSMMMVKKY